MSMIRGHILQYTGLTNLWADSLPRATTPTANTSSAMGPSMRENSMMMAISMAVASSTTQTTRFVILEGGSRMHSMVLVFCITSTQIIFQVRKLVMTTLRWIVHLRGTIMRVNSIWIKSMDSALYTCAMETNLVVVFQGMQSKDTAHLQAKMGTKFQVCGRTTSTGTSEQFKFFIISHFISILSIFTYLWK